jgi:hypothetical protein
MTPYNYLQQCVPIYIGLHAILHAGYYLRAFLNGKLKN